MRKASQAEQKIKKMIITELRKLPNLMVIDHRNSGTMRDGVYCPSSTTILGVSDLIIFPKFYREWPNVWQFFDEQLKPLGGKTYGAIPPFFVEIKTPKGAQSINQIQFQKDIEKLGYGYYIVRNWLDMGNILTEKGLI